MTTLHQTIETTGAPPTLARLSRFQSDIGNLSATVESLEKSFGVRSEQDKSFFRRGRWGAKERRVDETEILLLQSVIAHVTPKSRQHLQERVLQSEISMYEHSQLGNQFVTTAGVFLWSVFIQHKREKLYRRLTMYTSPAVFV